MKIQELGLQSVVDELRTCMTQQEGQIKELTDQVNNLETEAAQKPDVLDTEEYQQLKSGEEVYVLQFF